MLLAGVVTPSFGLNCAHMAGVNDSIIERAQQVITPSLQPAGTSNHMGVAITMLASHVPSCSIVDSLLVVHAPNHYTQLCSTCKFQTWCGVWLCLW